MKLIPKFQKGNKFTNNQAYFVKPGDKPNIPNPYLKPKSTISSKEFFESLPVNTNTYGPVNLSDLNVTAKDKTYDPVPLKEITVIGKKPISKSNQSVSTKPNQSTSSQNTNNKTYLKPKGEVNQKVIEWQNKLKAEGFDVGKIDGIWGKKTEEAYKAYLQNKKRLERVGNPNDNAPFIEARQGFPTPESAYLKQGGTIKFTYLQKGGKINGKSIPNDNDEYSIPTKDEGGTDMNPKFWKKDKPKIKPKTTVKKTDSIYKPKTKVEEKKKGGKIGKKCSCGCAMKISKNAKGGLIESCSCGCSMKKHQTGGNINKTVNLKEITVIGKKSKKDSMGTYEDAIGRLKKISQSEYKELSKKDPKNYKNFEATGYKK